MVGPEGGQDGTSSLVLEGLRLTRQSVDATDLKRVTVERLLEFW